MDGWMYNCEDFLLASTWKLAVYSKPLPKDHHGAGLTVGFLPRDFIEKLEFYMK